MDNKNKKYAKKSGVSRRSFIKRSVGTTLAFGIGLKMMNQNAMAGSHYCCYYLCAGSCTGS
jgi:hypothetical protein